MPWFRWLKKAIGEEAEQAALALEAQSVPAEAPAEPAVEEEHDDPATEAGAEARKRRRRGSRGGKGRKKPSDAAASEDGATASGPPARTSSSRDVSAVEGGGERGDRKKSSRPAPRRRAQPKRQPLPSAKRELVISLDVGEQRVAVLEDDAVAEVYLERPERRSIAGNIYLGTVDNVLPGMEAAFVEIGLEKNGFLYVDEIVIPELEGKARQGKKITDLIQRGQTLLVQAVKDPMKTKGARLTTEISLPGRFLVFVPQGEGLGVSRRLEDGERQRLKDILREIAPKDGGVIVRTAAEGASAEDIERDLVFLQRLWKTIQTRAKSAKAPELVYHEAELPLRIVRDLFAGDFVAAYVDNDRAYKRIAGYLKKTSPHMLERVHRYKEAEPLFEHFGIEREIASTLSRRVDLPSGGYLIFDYAEAFTVIDVNTGRFVGSRSKNTTQRLEDTIVKNNLEAVKEVVRQLRLRDIGGIIVIDFIDMANQKNRTAVEEALRQELERDRTKTYVVEISPLGLVEMTRQNVTDGPREVMTRRCPTCDGDGIVVSDATVALEIERKLRTLAAGPPVRGAHGYRIAVNPRVLTLLAGPGGERLIAIEEATKRRFLLEPAAGHAHTDHFEVLAEGKPADLRPEGPVVEDAVISVKLVEIALHDAAAASGKVEGVDVVVAGAAKLVGKTAQVRVGRVLGETAFAMLVDIVQPPDAITFESEAEKPTRAPAKRKSAEAPDTAEEKDLVDALAEEEDEDDGGAGGLEAEDGAEGEEDDAGDEESSATPRKRTRRGSRGGRRRRKPAGATVGDEGDEAAESEVDGGSEDPGASAAADDAEPLAAEAASGTRATGTRPPRTRTRAPRIHVPDSDTAGDTAGDPAGAPVKPAPRAKAGGAPRSAPRAKPVAAEPDGDAGAGPDEDGGEPVEGGDGAPRKRTRRGSRGGRGRSRKPAGAAATEGENATTESVNGSPAGDGEPASSRPARRVPEKKQEPSPTPEAPAGYVPMSEWIDDFDRR